MLPDILSRNEKLQGFRKYKFPFSRSHPLPFYLNLILNLLFFLFNFFAIWHFFVFLMLPLENGSVKERIKTNVLSNHINWQIVIRTSYKIVDISLRPASNWMKWKSYFTYSIYILSLTDRLFRGITNMQYAFTHRSFQAEIETCLTLW